MNATLEGRNPRPSSGWRQTPRPKPANDAAKPDRTSFPLWHCLAETAAQGVLKETIKDKRILLP